MTSAQDRSFAALRSLFPRIGSWAEAALWHGTGEPGPAPCTPLADELDAICDQRLAPLLLAYLDECSVPVSPEHREHLRRSAFGWTLTSHTVVAGSRDVLTRLAASGVRYTVSKGPGVAAHYADARWRPFSDIDLLVDGGDFGRVVADLEADGWYEESKNVQPRNYFRRYCREGLNLTRGAGRLDVHHRLPPWVWGTALSPTQLIDRGTAIEFLGHRMPVLRATDNLLVVALHLISDRNDPGKSLIVWRDLVELAKAVPVADAVVTARAAGLANWLRAVLLALPRPFGTQRLVRALGEHDEGVPHPTRLRLALSPRAAHLGVSGTQVLRLPVINGLAFLGGMALPSRDFLAGKYPGDSHPYRRWWSNSVLRVRDWQRR